MFLFHRSYRPSSNDHEFYLPLIGKRVFLIDGWNVLRIWLSELEEKVKNLTETPESSIEPRYSRMLENKGIAVDY